MADTEFTDATIRHRFFRDLVESERLKVFKAFGVYPEDCTERLDHSIERRLLNLILRRPALASRPAEVDDRTPRPISTAPHDGTEVLAWSKTGKTWHQVYWKTQEHGNWLWEKPFPPRWACRWNSDYYQGQNEFSHWLPIPGAPSHTTNKEK
jgi:hypothetical protein